MFNYSTTFEQERAASIILINVQKVNSEIWKITLPQITIPIDGPGIGEVNAIEFTLRTFKSLIFSFKLTPPNGIAWQSKGGSAELDAIWTLGYYFIVPIYLSGYVRAKLDNICVYMQTNLLVQHEHPQIEVTDCSMKVQQLYVYITGGVIQWIVNLFRAQLASVIKQTIHEKMCAIIRKAIIDTNAGLSALSTHIKLYENIYIGYSCKKNPIATSKYIEGEMLFDIIYGQGECMLPTEEMDDKIDSTKRMTYIWMSEHIPNCLLQTAYNNKNLTFAVISNASDNRFAGFLKTIIYFSIRLVEAPYTTIDANGIRIFASSIVDLYLSSGKQQSYRLARLVMNSTIYAVPAILHKRLVNTINVMIILREQDSIVGRFNLQALKLLEKIMAKAVKLIGGAILKIGVPLPLIDNHFSCNLVIIIQSVVIRYRNLLCKNDKRSPLLASIVNQHFALKRYHNDMPRQAK
ncbi:Uncharacterized protein ACO02O_06980 [Dirofilaria immitis]